jgi:hypothetical protein
VVIPGDAGEIALKNEGVVRIATVKGFIRE